METKKMWEIIRDGEISECLRCKYKGREYAVNPRIEHEDGELGVFCPVCHSTHLYIVEAGREEEKKIKGRKNKGGTVLRVTTSPQ